MKKDPLTQSNSQGCSEKRLPNSEICSFLRPDGSCGFGKSNDNASVLKIDTQNGVYQLNGKDISNAVSVVIKLTGDTPVATISYCCDIDAVVVNGDFREIKPAEIKGPFNGDVSKFLTNDIGNSPRQRKPKTNV